MKFPGRRALAFTTTIATGLMIMGMFFTNAHNAPLDDLGCHRDPPQSRYHCHSGFLKGKEFNSKEDAERLLLAVHAPDDDQDFQVTHEETVATAPASSLALAPVGRSPASEFAAKSAVGDKLNLPPVEGPATAVVNQNLLKIVSWKIKKREKMDVDRIANVLAEVDLAVLHDIDLDEVGRGPLHKMGDLLQSRIGEKICRLWFRNASGGKEKIGILWRNATVAHVENGSVKNTCGEMAVIVPMTAKKGERALASTMFFSKVQKKMFMLATANFETKPKELNYVFRPLEGGTVPTLVIGDLRTPVGNATVDLKKTYSFVTNITRKTSSKKGRGSKTGTENLWTRNATAARALAINLYDRFPEMSAKDIDSTVSDSFPILAEVELVPDTSATSTGVESEMQVIEKKVRREKTAPVKAKVISEARPPKPNAIEEGTEDLEAEAHEADDSDQRIPASSTTATKKKAKKKPLKKKR